MKQTGTILVVDDEDSFRENNVEFLGAVGFTTFEANQGEPALAHARGNAIDVAVVDIVMPGMDGISLLGRLKEVDPLMEVVMVTGQGSIETAVEAMRLGAYHYITKPVRLKELEMMVCRALEKGQLARQNSLYREELRRRRGAPAGEAVAASSSMRDLLWQAERIAQTDSTVLIEGETGCGKEVLAELIHRKSGRADKPLMVLNCGALSENLVDAELFGHEKGAFTGAMETRTGLIEVADGGTLLLDEIGDIPEAAQIRLLRFLERGVFRKVGSTREQAVDVRVLAATHRDLEHEVEQGRFREDLYHRLVVFRLAVPPLRDRQADIVPLAGHFLARLGGPGLAPKKLTSDAQAALCAYAWPGNVRELSHAIERACFAAQLAGASEIAPDHLKLPAPKNQTAVLVSLKEAERRHVLSVLEHVGDNREKTAEVLGISERHLYRLLKRFNEEDVNGDGDEG